MPKINSVWIRQHGVEDRKLILQTGRETRSSSVTVVTGRNGSGKSTLMKTIVSSLIADERRDALDISYGKDETSSSRVLCFSGSAFDRFPLKSHVGRPTAFDKPSYLYFGQLVGPNLLSRRAPIETILPLMLIAESQYKFNHPLFTKIFETVGLLPVLVVRMSRTNRAGRKAGSQQRILKELQDLANGTQEPDDQKSALRISRETASYVLETTPYDDFMDFDAILKSRTKSNLSFHISQDGMGVEGSLQDVSPESIRLGLLTEYLRVADVEVSRANGLGNGSIFDMSSGEFHMLISALGLLFAIEPNSVVLVDEPEGSLHPQWQIDLMHMLASLTYSFDSCHMIAATHSPLVVANAPEGSVVVDMDLAGAIPLVQAHFGQSSDQVLFDQFGISSSRNLAVIDVVQRAVSLVERGAVQSSEFEAAREDLMSLRRRLQDVDPLSDVIDSLLAFGDA